MTDYIRTITDEIKHVQNEAIGIFLEAANTFTIQPVQAKLRFKSLATGHDCVKGKTHQFLRNF